MDDYEMAGSEEQDRLSELPKPLLFQILSFLPMRDVVRTTFLSKSWENLWTTIPCLNFWAADTYAENYVEADRFRNFVNRALIYWEGTQIQKFEIVIKPFFDMPLINDMDYWVRFAVKRKVQELNIELHWDEYDYEELYIAPLCLSSCSSVRKLSLVGCSVQIHGPPAWNQLKCLKMRDHYLRGQFISQILLGAPQLEVFNLCLRENNEDLNIQSASLKKLSIEKIAYNGVDVQDEPSCDTKLKICCPNLETFEILGVPYCKCLLTNVSSLTDSKIWFDHESDRLEHWESWNELLSETMGQIFKFIQHVEKVALSEWCVQVLGLSLRKYLFSPLLNVKFLELELDGRIGLGVIVNILGIFPNINMLVIKDNLHIQLDGNAPEFNVLEFETKLSKSFSRQLKTIKITSYLECTSSFRFIEFLLKHACMLEKLEVCGQSSRPGKIDLCSQTHFLEVAKELLNAPRSSPTAKVVFKTS